MSPNPQAHPRTDVVIDRSSSTIVMTREFAAPRAKIFEAWTQPEHVARWWDPSGRRLTSCEIDLRVGGGFTFVPEGSPDVPAFSGIYREIAPPERLVFEAIGAIGTVLLENDGAGTRMTVSIACSSAAHLDQFLQVGVAADTARTLDNLVLYLEAAK